MKRFKINSKYLTSVKEEKPCVLYMENGEMLQGTSMGFIDHPEFTKLRDKLEAEGYIQTERTYWNGDRVLKPFMLNGNKFDKGEKFCCASALDIKFKVAKEYKL